MQGIIKQRKHQITAPVQQVVLPGYEGITGMYPAIERLVSDNYLSGSFMKVWIETK